MFSTRKKSQSYRSFLSQLEDLDQQNIFGATASEKQENTIVNESTGDRESTAFSIGKKWRIIENTVKVKTLERCFNQMIDREIINFVDMVEKRIQN